MRWRPVKCKTNDSWGYQSIDNVLGYKSMWSIKMKVSKCRNIEETWVIPGHYSYSYYQDHRSIVHRRSSSQSWILGRELVGAFKWSQMPYAMSRSNNDKKQPRRNNLENLPFVHCQGILVSEFGDIQLRIHTRTTHSWWRFCRYEQLTTTLMFRSSESVQGRGENIIRPPPHVLSHWFLMMS